MNGLEFKKKREETGLSQEALAKAIGTSSRTIQNWENSGIPKAKEALVINMLDEGLDMTEIVEADTQALRMQLLVRYMIMNGYARTQKEAGSVLGCDNSSLFSQVLNGKKSIPKYIAENLSKILPDINTKWLTDGEGEMTGKKDNAVSVVQVPLVPMTAQGGSLDGFGVQGVTATDCERIMSPFEHSTLAIRVSGESMAPKYPNGCCVFLQKINERAFIEWGSVFVLDTVNGVVLKVLTPSGNPNTVKCVSLNPDPIYAPFEVEHEDIRAVYKVLGSIDVS